MSDDKTILLGAVAYDPKVVPLWEGIREHFHEQGVLLDFALFSNYERQIDELLKENIDVAWNTPIEHVRVRHRTRGESVSRCRRGSRRELGAKVLKRRDTGIESLKDLAG